MGGGGKERKGIGERKRVRGRYMYPVCMGRREEIMEN